VQAKASTNAVTEVVATNLGEPISRTTFEVPDENRITFEEPFLVDVVGLVVETPEVDPETRQVRDVALTIASPQTRDRSPALRGEGVLVLRDELDSREEAVVYGRILSADLGRLHLRPESVDREDQCRLSTHTDGIRDRLGAIVEGVIVTHSPSLVVVPDPRVDRGFPNGGLPVLCDMPGDELGADPDVAEHGVVTIVTTVHVRVRSLGAMVLAMRRPTDGESSLEAEPLRPLLTDVSEKPEGFCGNEVVVDVPVRLLPSVERPLDPEGVVEVERQVPQEDRGSRERSLLTYLVVLCADATEGGRVRERIRELERVVLTEGGVGVDHQEQQRRPDDVDDTGDAVVAAHGRLLFDLGPRTSRPW